MDDVSKSGVDEDIPTPTKDETSLSETITNQFDDLACGSKVSDSRSCATPTLDENPVNPNCPTPTIDEPVEKFTTNQSDSLIAEEVKCKLFDKNINDGDKHSAPAIEVNNKERLGNVHGVMLKSAAAKNDSGTEKETLASNGNVPDVSKSLAKTMPNESSVNNEEQKQIVVTCDGELFTCNECDYTNKGHHFEEHLMCHLIHKPYQCLYCKEAFASRRQIGKHLATVHKGKKLNCMLKALNRAKTLMLDAQKTNSCVFLALVPASGMRRKRNLSTDSSGSTGILSRTTSDSDGSQRSFGSLPPSRQTSQLSEGDAEETSKLFSHDDTDKRTKSAEVSNESETKEADKPSGSPEVSNESETKEAERTSGSTKISNESETKEADKTSGSSEVSNKSESKEREKPSGSAEVSNESQTKKADKPLVSSEVSNESVTVEEYKPSESTEVSNECDATKPPESTVVSNESERKETPKPFKSPEVANESEAKNADKASECTEVSDKFTAKGVDEGNSGTRSHYSGNFVSEESKSANNELLSERSSRAEVVVETDLGQTEGMAIDKTKNINEQIGHSCNSQHVSEMETEKNESSENTCTEGNQLNNKSDVAETAKTQKIKETVNQLITEESSFLSVSVDKSDAVMLQGPAKDVSNVGDQILNEALDDDKAVEKRIKEREKSPSDEKKSETNVSQASDSRSVLSVEKRINEDEDDVLTENVDGSDIQEQAPVMEDKVVAEQSDRSSSKEQSSGSEDMNTKVTEHVNGLIHEEQGSSCEDMNTEVSRHAGGSSNQEQNSANENVQSKSEVCQKSEVLNDSSREIPSSKEIENSKERDDNENSNEKDDNDSNSMGLKIVASFSLEGDDFSKCDEENSESIETVKQPVSAHSDKSDSDTSGLVIDVFKDGRIAVHDTKLNSSMADSIETSSTKHVSSDTPSVDAEPEKQSKLKQTKLGQLLTSTTPMSAVLTSTLSTPTNETCSTQTGTNTTDSLKPVSSVTTVSSSPAVASASPAPVVSISPPVTSVSSSSAVTSVHPAVSSTGATTTVTPVNPSVTSGPCATSTTKQPTQTQVSVQGMTPAQMKHLRNPNFYVCGLNCNFSCLNSVDFRDHLFLGHSGEKCFPCYYCGWLAHTEESLLRHITNHSHAYGKAAPLYLCGMHRCKFGTNLLSDLLNHMQILHHDITEYICKECNDTFTDVKDLVNHFEDNFIHVVNCPHCACKGTDRRMILKHIAEYHPGKAKMVSVAKHIICRDRKVNNYKRIKAQYKSGANVMTKGESVVSQEKKSGASSGYTSLKEEQNVGQKVNVKAEDTSRESEYGSTSDKATAGSNGHSPAEKQISAPKCSHCTFVARDQRRLESHTKCHGLPVMKRHRFRCLYCPQGFDSSQKFRLHINCHPGLIKYWMYYCKRCDFDSNQRYVMLRHIRTRDELHINEGNEEDMFTVVERIMESRVLECEHCNYQTRHKLHLQIHYQREHKVVKAAAHSSSDSGKPTIHQVPWNSPPQSSSADSCQENMSKKFKCPFCRYLVPKAADLKSHVRKHANLGKITIDFLRCRYCSLSSTARDIVYSHIREKHAGKPLVLVRKIVTIDCSGNDNSFSETSVTEAPLTVTSSSHSVDRFQCETCSFATVDRREFESHVQLHNTTKGGIHSMSMEDDSEEDEDEGDELETGVDHPQPSVDDSEDTKPEVGGDSQAIDMIEQVYIIPETVAGDQLSSPARCCNCYYASGYRSAFIDHMTANHSDIMLVVRNKGTTVEQICPNGRVFFGLPVTLNNEVLLVPDRQVFTQAVKCPKCPNFATYFRRNLVLHLSKDHSEITAMGKCTWPGWQANSGGNNSAQTQSTANLPSPKAKSPKKSAPPPDQQDESCIIGSGDLDEQISCLYKNFGDRQQCLICNSSKPKKFFMHIHILRHLNIFLVKCPYCPHKGLQKYKIGRHIRTNHPEKENVVKDIKVDIAKKVEDFLAHQKKVVAAAAASPPTKHSSLASFMQSGSSGLLSPKSEKDAGSVNKMSGPLGTPYLDEKLVCLYTSVNGKNKCNLCSVEFARKYAIHRHIVVNHLKVSLLKCGHCDFNGVEKHVIIDHILEQHKNQPIQFEPLDINMEEKVQEFLTTYNVVKTEPGVPQQESSFPVSPQKISGPQSYCLGKDKLHYKLVQLFTRKGDSFKCNLCKWKFPRKYAIHRHILMKHLKIGLYGCTHCHVQGAEKYIVVSHMKEAHPKAAPQARVLEVDMDQRIQEVLQEASLGTGNHTAGRKPRSNSYNEEVASVPEDTKPNIQAEVTDEKQMVVAMFGKKRKPSPEPAPAEDDGVVTPKKLKTTSRMVDVSTKIKVVCVQDGTYKKYVCEKCRFTSLHRSNVYRHVLRIHERYRELQCEYCGYKTYSKVLLDQHIEVEHDGIHPSTTKKETTDAIKQEPGLISEDSKPDIPAATDSSQPVKHYACAYCSFETSTAENIIKHTRENHAPGGGETNKKEPKEASTPESKVNVSSLEHVVKKSSVKRGTFTETQMLYCGYCTFKAPGVQTVKDHHKGNHQPNKLCIISQQAWRYICRVCGLKNNAGSKMRAHLNRHLEYRPYTCTSCNQSYASTDELRKHVRNLRHSDNFQYLKHEKKEQKINRFLEESRKNALLVNIGAPPGEESMGQPSTKVSSTDELLDLKEPPSSPPPEPKFKGIKRAMKMPVSPTKSLKKKYWKTGLDRESKAITKDVACHWCDIPNTVSVDQMKQHHTKEHPEKEFLWVDTRQGNTCGVTGEIKIVGNLTETPELNDLYTGKQLANNKMKYYCTRCSFSAWYLPAMVSHCRCHRPKKYLCAYCHLRYSNRDYLERHQATFHFHRNLWILHMVETERSEHRPKSSTLTTAATKEIKMEEDTVDGDAAEAAAVDERRISQQVIYCCNFCPYQNESLYQYRLHLPLHGTFKYLKTDLSNDSPLKCGFCPYVAQDQTDFSLHITSHFENRSFKCAHCNYSAYARAHVRYHSANQHPDMEQRILDLSSAASYVEYQKEDTTNLPKLVNLDPRVLLTDIKSMTQGDLESLMSEELSKDLDRSCDKGEDDLIDEAKVDDDTSMNEATVKAAQPKVSVEVEKEGHSDPETTSHSSVNEEVQTVDSSVEPKMASTDPKPSSGGNITDKQDTSVTLDRSDYSGVVSSSVGTDEDMAEDSFDIAEVSAFVDDDADTSKPDKSDSDHNISESVGDGSINISGVKSIDDSADSLVDGKVNGDEVDGDSAESQDKATSSSKAHVELSERDKSPDAEEKIKKDDSANVFDTLHSWLSMK